MLASARASRMRPQSIITTLNTSSFECPNVLSNARRRRAGSAARSDCRATFRVAVLRKQRLQPRSTHNSRNDGGVKLQHRRVQFNGAPRTCLKRFVDSQPETSSMLASIQYECSKAAFQEALMGLSVTQSLRARTSFCCQRHVAESSQGSWIPDFGQLCATAVRCNLLCMTEDRLRPA